MKRNLKHLILPLVALSAVAAMCVPVAARQKVTVLPEVLVESSRRNMLHVLAYVREYSQLTTYSDTVTLFREKMVDFMLPGSRKSRYQGWRIPRIIKSESYYHFTNADGLDSVSDTSRHLFSWSDWMGLPPNADLPEVILSRSVAADTLMGKYSPAEVWSRRDDLIDLEINVLADTVARRWVPNMKSFFSDDKVEFADFKVRYKYANVLDKRLMQRDLTGYTYRVDAFGRGHDMFRFNRRDEVYFATTEAEVYVLDMEYITEKEAKKWGRRKYDKDETELIRAVEAPPIPDHILALMERVANIDMEHVRLTADIDRSMMRMERNRSKAGEALRYLKNITGLSDARAKHKQNKDWREFREKLKK